MITRNVAHLVFLQALIDAVSSTSATDLVSTVDFWTHYYSLVQNKNSIITDCSQLIQRTQVNSLELIRVKRIGLGLGLRLGLKVRSGFGKP